jgi:anti-anti-sigma factor
MNVKIDTKEKFSVIIPEKSEISANMTEEYSNLFESFLTKKIPHVVFNLQNVISIDENSLSMIIEMQQKFYNENYSFVICCIQDPILNDLKQKDFFDSMNITPTESEAWDIIQMEEIERELMDDQYGL